MVRRGMDRLARWIVAHPRRVVAAAFVLTLVLGTFAARIRIESSLESVLPAGDPAVAFYEEVRQRFGGDDVGVIGVIADDVFAPSTLEKIGRVTTAIGKLPGVESALSITNAKDIAADVFTPPPLLPRLPPTADDVAALQAKLLAMPLYRENLIAPNGKGAAINVFFAPMTDAQYLANGLDHRIEEILAAEQGPERWYFTGAAHVKSEAVALMRGDLLRFTPLALGLIVLVFWLSFRTKRGVLLPLAAVCMALVWTLGVMVVTGHAISLGTFVLPPLILVIGSSYAIHVMARYYEQAERGRPRREVVHEALRHVAMPLSISVLTTSIGFGALMVNRIPAIWEFGLFSVVGAGFLLIVCLFFVPAVLAMMPIERAAARAADGSPALVAVLTRVARVVSRSRRAIALGALLVTVVALVGVRRIHVDSDFLNYFTPSSSVRQANEIINREIVGSNPFYIVIEGREKGAMARWQSLWLVNELQGYLRTLPGISSSISLVDYLELLDAGLASTAGNDLVVDEQGQIKPAQKPKSFWEDPAMLEPALKLVRQTPETFQSVVTPDFTSTSILVRTSLSGSRAVEATLARIRAFVAEHFPAEFKVHLTGSLVLMTGTTSAIVQGQVESLAIALGTIFVVMSVMFLSVRIGALAILPNVLPIVLFFGVMGWLGILLNQGTSLIAAITLGIAIDNTIHYMARLNRELRGETDQAAAISRTLTSVGVPIVSTSVALFLGFLTFAFSRFVPIQNFGTLSSVTLGAAMVANLVLLPALLATFKIITLWDLVGVKLGEDPARTIPLFGGLRPSQARVVVLMGDLRRYKPGEHIVRQGEEGDAMFVLLNGRAEVWAGDPERRRVAELARGDVFGEMGLVRHNERTADVVADGDVEVLAVDQRFLERIQRRYPRIASKVFLNLTRILSDKLERTTTQFVAAGAGGRRAG